MAWILCVVAPVLQKYKVAILDIRVTLPPWQKVVFPFGVIVGVAGFEFTVTVVGTDEAEHPSEFVTVTE